MRALGVKYISANWCAGFFLTLSINNTNCSKETIEILITTRLMKTIKLSILAEPIKYISNNCRKNSNTRRIRVELEELKKKLL